MIHKKIELIYFINLCEKKHNKLKMFTLGDSMPLQQHVNFEVLKTPLLGS